MERAYQTIEKQDTWALAHFLSKDGQAWLPMVELIIAFPARFAGYPQLKFII